MEMAVPCCSKMSFSDKFKDFGVGVLQLAAFELLLELLLIEWPNKLIELPDLPDLLDFFEGFKDSMTSTSWSFRKLSRGIGLAWSLPSLDSLGNFYSSSKSLERYFSSKFSNDFSKMEGIYFVSLGDSSFPNEAATVSLLTLPPVIFSCPCSIFKGVNEGYSRLCNESSFCSN